MLAPLTATAPIAREDVTERKWGVELFAGPQRIGNVVEQYHGTGKGTASWRAYQWIVSDCGGWACSLGFWPNFEAAVSAVVDAENARRKDTPQ